MKWQMRGAIAAAMILLAAPVASRADEKPAGPAFDCTKASGEVEELICADAGLAALDRKLDSVYKAALAKARDDMPKQLKAEQQGWISGRNDCWKAKGKDNPAYLTESWVATSVRECVEGEYKLRIAELQVQYQLVPAKKPVFFAGPNNDELVATFFETEPPAVRLERGDRTVIAYQVQLPTGARYEGQNVRFAQSGNEATATWLGEEIKYKLR